MHASKHGNWQKGKVHYIIFFRQKKASRVSEVKKESEDN